MIKGAIKVDIDANLTTISLCDSEKKVSHSPNPHSNAKITIFVELLISNTWFFIMFVEYYFMV